jgi:hypothetical protein
MLGSCVQRHDPAKLSISGMHTVFEIYQVTRIKGSEKLRTNVGPKRPSSVVTSIACGLHDLPGVTEIESGDSGDLIETLRSVAMAGCAV